MVLSHWLYETLPFLYTAVGLLSFLRLDSLLGRISSILLISAGVMIWIIRHEARKAGRRR